MPDLRARNAATRSLPAPQSETTTPSTLAAPPPVPAPASAPNNVVPLRRAHVVGVATVGQWLRFRVEDEAWVELDWDAGTVLWAEFAGRFHVRSGVDPADCQEQMELPPEIARKLHAIGMRVNYVLMGHGPFHPRWPHRLLRYAAAKRREAERAGTP